MQNSPSHFHASYAYLDTDIYFSFLHFSHSSCLSFGCDLANHLPHLLHLQVSTGLTIPKFFAMLYYPFQNVTDSNRHPIERYPFFQRFFVCDSICYIIHVLFILFVFVHKPLWGDIPLPIGSLTIIPNCQPYREFTILSIG